MSISWFWYGTIIYMSSLGEIEGNAPRTLIFCNFPWVYDFFKIQRFKNQFENRLKIKAKTQKWSKLRTHIWWANNDPFRSAEFVHTQSCPTLCDLTDCSPPGSSVHGILQARILQWVALSSSRGSSWPRKWTHVSWVSCIGRWILYHWATWDVSPFKKWC